MYEVLAQQDDKGTSIDRQKGGTEGVISIHEIGYDSRGGHDELSAGGFVLPLGGACTGTAPGGYIFCDEPGRESGC